MSIPLLAVAARDDPIIHCDALRATEFSEENENLLFLITERGGHVGWPKGLLPWQHGWDFMNEAMEMKYVGRSSFFHCRRSRSLSRACEKMGLRIRLEPWQVWKECCWRSCFPHVRQVATMSG